MGLRESLFESLKLVPVVLSYDQNYFADGAGRVRFSTPTSWNKSLLPPASALPTAESKLPNEIFKCLVDEAFSF